MMRKSGAVDRTSTDDYHLARITVLHTTRTSSCFRDSVKFIVLFATSELVLFLSRPTALI